MNHRDYLHKKAVDTQNEEIMKEYKKIRNRITKNVKRAKHELYQKLTEENKGNTRKFWKELGKVFSIKINTSSIPKSLSEDVFNAYFFTIGSITADSVKSKNDLKEPWWKGAKSIHNFKLSQVEVSSVRKYLCGFTDRSNSDVLGFDSKLLKLSADLISPHLTHLFNLSIKEGHMPKDWKVARITPVYKGTGDMGDPGNYRPISVVCHIGKLMEKQIYVQLINYLNIHSFITQDQSAYLANHSTQTSLHRVVNDWLETMNERDITGVCFLDIKKCFDTIDHTLLLHKLSYYGINNYELKWFNSYLDDRTQKTVCNGKCSTEQKIHIGVPQGSVLGPVLFLLFINDIVNCIVDGTVNCYADDVVIYVHGKDIDEINIKLQKCLIQAEMWYTSNRLVVNTSKTKIMLTATAQRMSRIDRSKFKVYYDGKLLSYADNIKYLGIVIDECLNWDKQVAHIRKAVGYKLALMRRISSFVPPKLLDTIFKTYLQPVLEYGSTVWGFCSEENIEKIQHLQNMAARITTSSYDFINIRGIDLVQKLEWQTFIQRRDYLTASLMHKCVYGQAPYYLCNNIHLLNDMNSRSTRHSEANKLLLPKPNIDKFKRSFQYAGGQCWNNMDDGLRSEQNIISFKKKYKQHYWHFSVNKQI
jgi:hypothetical protein